MEGGNTECLCAALRYSFLFTAEKALPDNLYENFSLVFYAQPLTDVSDKTVIGGYRHLAFPILQRCDVGGINWNETQTGSEEPKEPAPVVFVDEKSTTTSVDGITTSSEAASRSIAVAGLVIGCLGFIFGAVGMGVSAKLLNTIKNQ